MAATSGLGGEAIDNVISRATGARRPHHRSKRFTFNARIEEAATKPMWREPLKKFRCLVPAMGWYEWKEAEQIDSATGEVKKVKQPYSIHLPGKKLIHFAGLMSKRNAENEVRTLLLDHDEGSGGPAAEVHTRMPVILADELPGLVGPQTIR